jgi:hypothetical protein
MAKGIHGLLKVYTGEPRFNESEGTRDFVLYSRVLLLQGLFTIRAILPVSQWDEWTNRLP